MAQRSRIVLLHATMVAVDPIHEAFRKLWPEAEAVNLLDDALTIDRARADELRPDLQSRFVSLCHYAASLSADGILITCSAFGPAIDQAASEISIPVLKPNAPMFDAALREGKRIAMIATFAPAVVTMEQEFVAQARAQGSAAILETFVLPDAMAALRGGDAESHNRLVTEKGASLSGFDAIMLAHFSTSRAADLLRSRTTTPVLSAPEASVLAMREALVGQPG